MDHSPLPRRVQRIRHELRRRDVEVIRTTTNGANFVSVTFTGDALADFLSASFDDHVKFIFSDDNGDVIRRDYTPRAFDPAKRELTIEFALHGDGKASTWAQRASRGSTAIIGGPKGSMIIPLDYDWHLLVGDATALPAINRRLEELPAASRALVIVQVNDPADRRALHSQAQLELQWVDSPEQLISALRQLQLPSADGFAWGAGEASMMAQARAIIANEKGHPKDAMRVAAYWRHGVSDYHAELS
ncbi:siderophore-interacting protein [Pseudomonas panipatensis]|uniref:NADPH-dependent ferric siderophore reductase, contains FAD-binding and SIP domains n=1 Tax=Pseudomonas panipatensis TaxID=428992 RepID=A0A1G8MS29_9PSED|nr:siderophore-interacting protein [Pseudomonas panipatensis]SDI70848.1 NADPH-dependent ferric siderophore reductase, contains FAD-binding and SIP domains [Pseudomonas panipatensis]SMP78230.1 NADPH-dependent ferric siderophore reductase, contains FAD-binding and SIP domains [Pseudomonas panipatensis]